MLAKAPGDQRHRQPHDERRTRERGENEADQRSRQADRIAVNRHEDRVDFPGHRHQRVDHERAPKLDVQDEIERARQRMRLVRRMGPGQREPMSREEVHRDQWQQREQRERHAKAGVIDAEAHEQRSHDRRRRIAEREQPKVPHAQVGPAHFACRVLRRDLERHERNADQHRGDKQ